MTEIEHLLLAKEGGARFDSLITIGRQNLYLRRKELRRLAKDYPSAGAAIGSMSAARSGDRADDFLISALAVKRLEALDVDSYEGATVMHDLNYPLPDHLDERFDAVLDGGTLEHIFDVRTALASLMRLTKINGRLVVSTPANNLCGHGFYQFSPEFMFRALSEPHGFKVERLWMTSEWFPSIELAPTRGRFEVADPATTGERVSLRTSFPVMITVTARKVEHRADPFSAAPQQSDYSIRWASRTPHGRRPPKLSQSVIDLLRGLRQLQEYRFRNRRFFTHR